mmetsp:Transcript_70715/g.229786  ORF Transcript_70715/g.229786 Transcript_70715/m.229786 type:complete len:86 (+) Transcript_70715:174-431(+)
MKPSSILSVATKVAALKCEEASDTKEVDSKLIVAGVKRRGGYERMDRELKRTLLDAIDKELAYLSEARSGLEAFTGEVEAIHVRS